MRFIYTNGAPCRNRIHNLLIRSQTLYPVELMAHKHLSALIYYQTIRFFSRLKRSILLIFFYYL